ncbi:peptidylprolyl isomerase [Cohnella terricola]|uniref:PpiC domain-containing protein n=1 Tax=Cohnella terricola TaxID=1289167 RepID=A0A559JX74_9BACL|nr:peptidylprolyl isomerase [Cohnella terricola]TVY04479.1 hypothetical protein FPZ45_02560 [Cohnella terricola]
MNERNENELNDKQELASHEAEQEIAAASAVADPAPLAAPEIAAPARSSSATVVPWVVAVVAIAALVFVLIRGTSAGTENEAIAKMDGVTIKKSDIYDEIEKQFGKEQMISLIDNVAQTRAIEMESKKAGVTITDEDVKEEIDNIIKQYGMASEADLTNALIQSGATLDDFKNKQIIPNLKILKLFESKHPVTDDELKAYFEKNKETKFATTPKEVKASHILLHTKEEAEAVLAELKAGKDFATLAKEKSQDPGSKDQGGDLGFFGPGEMNSGFETAAFALAKGEMSDVVEAESGFHIIKVTDIKEAVVSEYDAVKKEVKLAYYEEKRDTEGQAWLKSFMKDKNYKNLLEDKPELAASAPASPEASPSASAESSPAKQ